MSRVCEVNRELWSQDHVARYAHRRLRPVEVIILARYSRELARRVLEVGCGAGRILGYLCELSEQAYGIDVNAKMLDCCEQHYPSAVLTQWNLIRLKDYQPPAGGFDVVLVPDNTLDVLGHAERLEALAALRGLICDGGLLIFSGHNLDGVGHGDGPAPRLRDLSLGRALDLVMGIGRRRANRRRLGALSEIHADHALLNDSEGDYGAVHYYMTRGEQERQLQSVGLTLVECLDPEGRRVGDEMSTSPWLHYVARRRPIKPVR